MLSAGTNGWMMDTNTLETLTLSAIDISEIKILDGYYQPKFLKLYVWSPLFFTLYA